MEKTIKVFGDFGFTLTNPGESYFGGVNQCGHPVVHVYNMKKCAEKVGQALNCYRAETILENGAKELHTSPCPDQFVVPANVMGKVVAWIQQEMNL